MSLESMSLAVSVGSPVFLNLGCRMAVCLDGHSQIPHKSKNGGRIGIDPIPLGSHWLGTNT